MKVLACWKEIQLLAEYTKREAAIFAGGKLKFALTGIMNMVYSSSHIANVGRINVERSIAVLRLC